MELNAKGRPLRRASSVKVDYATLLDEDKVDERGRPQSEDTEEDLENWVKTISNFNQERQGR